jgi:hypothetical protein
MTPERLRAVVDEIGASADRLRALFEPRKSRPMRKPSITDDALVGAVLVIGVLLVAIGLLFWWSSVANQR